MRPLTILPLLFWLQIAIPGITIGQTTDTLTVASMEKLAREVKDETAAFTAKMNQDAGKRLEALKQQEAKLEKYLPKEELAKAQKLRAELDQKLDALAGFANTPDSVLKILLKGPYIARFDSLETLFKFALPNTGSWPVMNDAAVQIQRLKSELAMLGELEKWLENREQQWKNLLSGNTLEKLQMPKAFGKWQEEVLAYKMQVQHWKETIKDPQKIETEALRLLNKLPAFREFMSKNGELARLFGPPAGATGLPAGTPIPGLQTRQSLAQELQNRFGANALQSGGALQQQMQNGMDQLSSQQQNPLNNLPGFENLSFGNATDAALTPKQQENAALKSKTFKERLEFGWNMQSATRLQNFPAVRDVGLSLGYKINPRSVMGIGVAYKFALGESWKNIDWTHEGIGLRSFLDWRVSSAGSKLLQNIWLTGGFEMNYWSRIANDVQWKDLAWEKNAVLGISKEIKFRNKIGKIQVIQQFSIQGTYPISNNLNFRFFYGL